jgi:hypothetical protein
MVSVLTSSAVDRGFESRSGQTKDYQIDICCFSTKHAALRRRGRISKDRQHNGQNKKDKRRTDNIMVKIKRTKEGQTT